MMFDVLASCKHSKVAKVEQEGETDRERLVLQRGKNASHNTWKAEHRELVVNGDKKRCLCRQLCYNFGQEDLGYEKRHKKVTGDGLL